MYVPGKYLEITSADFDLQALTFVDANVSFSKRAITPRCNFDCVAQ